ncbi:MAG TPA: UDP-3-O-(3-hydroxymyristoyl)glucosamine N-acyltransferase [Gammaproteobacteria bacterium]|nr:UDP-3-O-(3-hydroxymyristoyl)glucosamine N-acyltransferase [Gammaproteobacteria bacterium]
MSATLQTIAARFGCELRGDASHSVDHVAPLATADPRAVAFLANPKFVQALPDTRAGAVILTAEHAQACPSNCLIAANPYATYGRVAAWLHPPAPLEPGCHASAVVCDDAQVDASASIGALSVIEAGAFIGPHTRIGAGSVIGARARIGADTRIAENVSIGARVRVGDRCIVHAGAVIGADGFGFAPDDGGWVKIPQLGSVWIGDDVEVGANTTIDRGTMDDTVIADGVKLDNLVQVAHNVHIGEHSLMAAMSGAAGSTIIGKRCMIGGGAVLINHITLCDDVLVQFRSVVTKSIREPGTWSGSLPAEEVGRWRRQVARLRQIDKLAARVRALEQAAREPGSGE